MASSAQLPRHPALACPRAQHPDLPAPPVQMLGSWPGLRDFGANATGQQRHQQPLAYNFSLPWKCHLTTVPQMSCTLSHLFTIFSAHQAGLVGLYKSALWRSLWRCRSMSAVGWKGHDRH